MTTEAKKRKFHTAEFKAAMRVHRLDCNVIRLLIAHTACIVGMDPRD